MALAGQLDVIVGIRIEIDRIEAKSKLSQNRAPEDFDSVTTEFDRLGKAEPERRFLGVEVHTPGVGALMAALEDQNLTNVRVLEGDVVPALERLFQPGSLDRVQIFFPDPWPKKRHHKRRLIQPPFLERLAPLVRPGGHLWLATDWAPYAEAMVEALAEVPAWKVLPAAPPRPETRFERRGLKKGHAVVDLFLERLP